MNKSLWSRFALSIFVFIASIYGVAFMDHITAWWGTPTQFLLIISAVASVFGAFISLTNITEVQL